VRAVRLQGRSAHSAKDFNMTRQEITMFVKDLLGEYSDDPTGSNPHAWNRLINTAADDLARSTDCLYTTSTVDLIAGQSQYCAPQLYKLNGVSCWYSDGTRVTLQPAMIQSMDESSGGWRDDAVSNPEVFMNLGTSSIVIYPTPSYSSVYASVTDLVIGAGGVTATSATRPFVASDLYNIISISGGTGFYTGKYVITAVNTTTGAATFKYAMGVPSSVGGIATIGTQGVVMEGWAVPGDYWPVQSAACPLPDRAHIAVAYKAALLRIMQHPTADNLARRPMIEAEYRRMRGDLEAEVRTYTKVSNMPSYVGDSFLGGGGVNPLDL
jgi:hypothetical protein